MLTFEESIAFTADWYNGYDKIGGYNIAYNQINNYFNRWK